MRNRKEINAFNISFLDILAGALGAVILLFIVVPKVSIQDVEKLEQIEKLEIQMQSLDSLIAFAKDAIPQEDYLALLEKSQNIMATISELNKKVAHLQQQLQRKSQENEDLLKQLRVEEQKVQALENQIRQQENNRKEITSLTNQLQQSKTTQSQLQNKIAQLEKELKSRPLPRTTLDIAQIKPKSIEQPQPIDIPSTSGLDSTSVIAFDPPFAVVISWLDPSVQVRLFLKDVASNQWCFYQAKRRKTSFGQWQKLGKITGKPHEAIVQNETLVPGEYEVYATISKPKSGAKIDLNGYAAINTTNGVKKVDFGQIMAKSDKPPMMKNSGDSYLGKITISEKDIQWNSNK